MPGKAQRSLAGDRTVVASTAPRTEASATRTDRSIGHDSDDIYGDDRRFALEALNRHTRLGGGAATLNAVAFTRRAGAGFATSMRLHTDTAPLFAASG